MPVRLGLLVVLVLGPLAACGDSQGEDPTAHRDVAAEGAAVRLVQKTEADLVLYVSNQSFDDEEVRLTVRIDDATVVDGVFSVGDQHNWVSFPLAMAPGGHEVTAEADSGATLRESLRVRRGKTGYAVIDHWTEDGSGDLSWQFQWEPVAFG